MPSIRKRPEAMNAIDMLIEDHRTVQKLFKAFEKVDETDEETRIEIVESTCAELKIHALLEEEIFYPAVRSKIGEQGENLLNEAAVEHEVADTLIEKLAETGPEDPLYAAYFTVLCEYVEHHLEEEEKELFPKVKKLKDLDLDELAAEMRARRDELSAEFETEHETADDAEKEGGSQPPHARREGEIRHKRPAR